MSVGTGWEVQAVIEAIEACRRLATVLAGLADDHEHAITVARVDWEGPHRLQFDDRAVRVQRQLHDGIAVVSHVCRALEDALTESLVAAQVTYG